MSESILITPSLGSAVVTAAEAARISRDELLHQAAMVTKVEDRIDADDATNVLRSLKAFANTIETARTAAKAPALDLGRKIDALAKDLVARVEIEAARISRIVGAFEAEERRKAEEARRAADAEAARIAAEASRKAAEVRRAASNAEAGDRAADAVVETAQQQIVAVRQVAANAVAPKQAGTQVREDVCFEVTDIKALFAAHPELVVLEPNGSAIRAILRANPNLQVPGLRHWKEAKLNVR
jgi:hypothetical protein